MVEDQVERGLILLGATAIEDRLQYDATKKMKMEW